MSANIFENEKGFPFLPPCAPNLHIVPCAFAFPHSIFIYISRGRMSFSRCFAIRKAVSDVTARPFPSFKLFFFLLFFRGMKARFEEYMLKRCCMRVFFLFFLYELLRKTVCLIRMTRRPCNKVFCVHCKVRHANMLSRVGSCSFSTVKFRP